MSNEKNRQKKKHHKKKSDEQTNKRPQSRLFTEIDANSVEISGYTVGRGAPQTNKFVPDNVIPTGVVGIDESVKLPTSPSKTNHEQTDIKPNHIFRSKENHGKEHIHLPPISQYPYPYEYYPLNSNQQFHDQFVYSYPIYDEQYPSTNFHNHHHHHRHQHHQHQKHHHHHQHHKHKTEIETYDPRWWYMPINSVHRPKQLQTPSDHHYHYSPPKWYESPNRQNGIIIKTAELLRPSRDKYTNCRCEVCSPSKEPPHGSRWIAYT